MASRTETALKDVSDDDLMPSFDKDEADDAQPAPEAPEASPEPQEATTEPESAPEGDEPAVAETAPDTPPAEPEAPADEPGQTANVPSWRLKEESDRRREAETNYSQLQQQFGQLQGQLAAMQQQLQPQQPVEQIDPYENPEAYIQQQNAQTMNAVNARFAQQSRVFAEQLHGKETVDAAYEWAINNLPVHECNAIAQSVDPAGQCVARKKQHDALQEFGTDPAAYRERVLTEALKDPEFVSKVQVAQRQQVQGQANPQTQNRIDLPPSLDNVPAAADAKADAGATLPTSDADLFNDALAYQPFKQG